MSTNQAYVLTKQAKISEVVDECPKVLEYLAEYGLLCVNCIFNQFDTIETGAKVHNMSDMEIDKMVKEINKQLKKDLI